MEEEEIVDRGSGIVDGRGRDRGLGMVDRGWKRKRFT